MPYVYAEYGNAFVAHEHCGAQECAVAAEAYREVGVEAAAVEHVAIRNAVKVLRGVAVETALHDDAVAVGAQQIHNLVCVFAFVCLVHIAKQGDNFLISVHNVSWANSLDMFLLPLQQDYLQIYKILQYRQG